MRPTKKAHGEDQLVIRKGFLEVYRADIFVQPHFKEEHIVHNLGRFKSKDKILVIAEHIPARTKELLREQEVDYVDVNGNCYMKSSGLENLYLQVEGRKIAEFRKEKFPRPFAKAGLKVTYLFLNNPALLNASYRDIAEKAGVALGSIKLIIDGLIEEGFVVRKNRKVNTLKNFDELLLRGTIDPHNFGNYNNYIFLRYREGYSHSEVFDNFGKSNVFLREMPR